MADQPVLSVRNLTVDYTTERGAVRAVDAVDLELHAGGFLGIVGESGSGKSTLLFAIAQLLSPPGRDRQWRGALQRPGPGDAR